MRNKNDAGAGNKPPANPARGIKRPAAKEDAFRREIAKDPKQAAELLKEILKRK